MCRQTGVLRRVVIMVNHSLNLVGSPLKRGRWMESSFLASANARLVTRAAWTSAFVAIEDARESGRWDETIVKESSAAD